MKYFYYIIGSIVVLISILLVLLSFLVVSMNGAHLGLTKPFFLISSLIGVYSGIAIIWHGKIAGRINALSHLAILILLLSPVLFYIHASFLTKCSLDINVCIRQSSDYILGMGALIAATLLTISIRKKRIER